MAAVRRHQFNPLLTVAASPTQTYPSDARMRHVPDAWRVWTTDHDR
jgi:hypothetical protein